MTTDIVSKAIVGLFETERFYAEIVMRMRRIMSKRIPTAGVRIKDEIELIINPEWFTSISELERIAILKHEAEHILRDHISRSKELAPDVYGKAKDEVEDAINEMKHKCINIAADCAINGGIRNIGERAMFPNKFNLEDGQTMEWYFEKLKDNEKAKNFMEFDDHSLWAESDADKDVLREKVRQAINKAARAARAAGCMTSNQELLVSTLNTRYIVNWRDQLKRFAAKSIECQLEPSKKKRNRRYGTMYPGIRKIEELHLGVAIDTSGSVSDEALQQFMAEIGQISKYAKVTVVEADAEIKNSYVYKPKKEYKLSGRGGTAYQPAFDFFNKTDIDGMIYFGDMDSSDEPKKPGYPVLWAVVGHQEPPGNFGNRIEVKI